MLGRFVVVFLDDILIFSVSLSEHILKVKLVLRRLLQHKLYVNAEKCHFLQTQVTFLGYLISRHGVQMDEQKVEAVLKWKKPVNRKELQRFLGFDNFYRRFIRNFSSVAALLTSLLRGGHKKLIWNTAVEEAFANLKASFTTAPMLKHPDPNLPFVVEVDASDFGVGAVLSQRQGNPAKLFPCAYFSKKLSPTESNYDVGNQELLAIKLALGEWRHWLEGALQPFTVLTDHRNLEYLRTAKRLNSRQARWALFFSRFDFVITYCPDSKNGKADALSRQFEKGIVQSEPQAIFNLSCILAPIRWEVEEDIRQASLTDKPPDNCPPNRFPYLAGIDSSNGLTPLLPLVIRVQHVLIICWLSAIGGR